MNYKDKQHMAHRYPQHVSTRKSLFNASLV